VSARNSEPGAPQRGVTDTHDQCGPHQRQAPRSRLIVGELVTAVRTATSPRSHATVRAKACGLANGRGVHRLGAVDREAPAVVARASR
jgi:hypothetical protein